MKITQEQIKQLTELHPNNAVLGAAVREDSKLSKRYQ